MSIKNLAGSVPQIPNQIKIQIEKALKLRGNSPQVTSFVNSYPLLVASWNTENKNFLNYSASLIIDSYILSYLNKLEDFLKEEYGHNVRVQTSASLTIQVAQIQSALQSFIGKNNLHWVNDDFLNTVVALQQSISMRELSLEDLNILANIGQRELDYIDTLIKSKESIEDLRQSFLTYINNLLNGGFIDRFEFKMNQVQNPIKRATMRDWVNNVHIGIAKVQRGEPQLTDKTKLFPIVKPFNV